MLKENNIMCVGHTISMVLQMGQASLLLEMLINFSYTRACPDGRLV